MTPKQIDSFCSTLPAATRTVQWEGVVVFKVGGKMFCLIAPPDHSIGRICFKCPSEHYEALSHSPGFRPAPYLARAKWVALESREAIPTTELRELLREAYDLVVAKLPKKTQAGLTTSPKSKSNPKKKSRSKSKSQPKSKKRRA